MHINRGIYRIVSAFIFLFPLTILPAATKSAVSKKIITPTKKKKIKKPATKKPIAKKSTVKPTAKKTKKGALEKPATKKTVIKPIATPIKKPLVPVTPKPQKLTPTEIKTPTAPIVPLASPPEIMHEKEEEQPAPPIIQEPKKEEETPTKIEKELVDLQETEETLPNPETTEIPSPPIMKEVEEKPGIPEPTPPSPEQEEKPEISEEEEKQAVPTPEKKITPTPPTKPTPQPETPSSDFDDFDDFDFEATLPPTKAPKKDSEPDFDDFDFEIDETEKKAPKKEKPAAPVQEFGIPIDVPYIGEVTLIPFTDAITKKSGYKAKFSDEDHKIVIGALTIDEGTISIIDKQFGITGRATIFDKHATFGLKEAVMGEKRSLQKAVLGITFTDQPTLELLPGKSITMEQTDLILEKNKPLTIMTTTTLFGQTIQIGFVFTKSFASAFMYLPANTPLAQLIPDVNNTPLGQAIIKKADIRINNMWSQNKEKDPFNATIEGSLSIDAASIGAAPGAQLDALTFNATITKKGTKATIAVNNFPMQSIGTITNAFIIVDTTGSPKIMQLTGNLVFNVTDVGDLAINVASKITQQGVEFSGTLPHEFNYGDISIKNLTASFDTNRGAAFLDGDSIIEGLKLKVRMLLAPNPEKPGQKNIEFSAKGAFDEFSPFASTNIPVLETIKATNVDADIYIEKKDGKITSTTSFKGDVHLLGRSLKSIIKIVYNDTGKKGVYIDAPLTKDAKLEDIFPDLKDLIGSITLNEASFFMSSIDFFDKEKKVMVKKGLSFYAKVPLIGPLAPAAKLLGNKADDNGTPKLFTMYGKIVPEKPQQSEFGILLSQGTYDPDAQFSLGEIAIEVGPILNGMPQLNFVANVIFRPKPEEEYIFTGKFTFKADVADLQASMTGTWNNAFGMSGWVVKNPALLLGMAYGSPGIPTEIGGAGELIIKDFLTLKGAFLLDATFKNIAFDSTATKAVTFYDIALFLAEAVGLHIPTVNLPMLKIYDVHGKYATRDTKIGPVMIERGIAAQGKADFLGATANMDAHIDSSGLKAYGSIDKINLANIITMTGRTENGNPEVDIELSLLRQAFKITGILDIAGIYREEAFFQIAKDGIEFNFESNLGGDKFMWQGNPLFLSQVHGQSSGSLMDPDFTIEIIFKQYLKKYLLEQIEAGFDKAQRAVEQELGNAQQEINKIYPAIESMKKQIDSAEQAVADAKKTLEPINQAIEEVQEKYAAAQEKVDSIKTAIQELDSWYYGLDPI